MQNFVQQVPVLLEFLTLTVYHQYCPCTKRRLSTSIVEDDSVVNPVDVLRMRKPPLAVPPFLRVPVTTPSQTNPESAHSTRFALWSRITIDQMSDVTRRIVN